MKKKPSWILLVLVILLLQGERIYAAEAVAEYGSLEYLWDTQEISPIGVYLKSDVTIGTYEICIEYDPSLLKYLNGADERIDNHLYIRGEGDSNELKRMLHFEPLVEGSTTIRILSAAANTKADEANGIAAEPITLTALDEAPVTIGTINEESLEELPEEQPIITDEEQEHIAPPDDSETSENPEISKNQETPKGSEIPETSEIQQVQEEQKVPEIPVQPEHLEQPDFEWETVLLAIVTGSLFILIILKQLQLHRKRQGTVKEYQEDGWEDDDLDIINLEQTIIEAKHLTMEFKLSTDEASSLKEFFIKMIKRENQFRLFSALRDISFEIKQGDVVGIIGSNGSGKSTLLKIISGALIPSKGTIQVDKSKVQILTLGTGFDMELTGKENVYLNGAIIGYTKEYLDEKYQDIVQFAELEGFMEERMKNYSSGMVSRLGFAIATMRDAPEILILDEVLSVGDMFFRKKSEKRIKELIHSGSTVIMVSHSMDTILKNCNKVIWIEKGKLMEIGSPKKICANYQQQRTNYETAVNHLQPSGQ